MVRLHRLLREKMLQWVQDYHDEKDEHSSAKEEWPALINGIGIASTADLACKLRDATIKHAKAMHQRKVEQEEVTKLWAQGAVGERSAAHNSHNIVADDRKLTVPGREQIINGCPTMEPQQIMEARAHFWGSTM